MAAGDHGAGTSYGNRPQMPGTGNTSAGSEGAPVTSLLTVPWDPRLVFGSVFESSPPVVFSRDGGETWASAAANLSAQLPVQDLAAGNPQARRVYLTTMGAGVWQRDGDGNWEDISNGLPQRHAMPLLADPVHSAGELLAGTMASGVYERVGDSPWQPLGHGLAGPASTVMSLEEESGSPPILLAATSAGVFRYVP